jgi:hypothetical protein
LKSGLNERRWGGWKGKGKSCYESEKYSAFAEHMHVIWRLSGRSLNQGNSDA